MAWMKSWIGDCNPLWNRIGSQEIIEFPKLSERKQSYSIQQATPSFLFLNLAEPAAEMQRDIHLQ